MGEDDVAVAALVQATRDHGRRIVEDPARVRGLLNDVLGSQARAHRDRVDVLATAAALAARPLLSGDEPAAREALQGGLPDADVEYALGAWSAALGPTTALPATVARDDSPPARAEEAGTAEQAAVAPAPAIVLAAPATALPAAVATGTQPSAAVSPAVGAPPVTPGAGPNGAGPAGAGASRVEGSPHRRMTPVLVAVGVAVALVLGLGVWALTGDDGEQAVAEPTVSPTAAEPVTVELGEEKLAWGGVAERSWSVTPEGLTAVTVVTNPGKTPVSGWVVEALPKDVAASVSEVDFAPEPDKVVKADPVVAYRLRLGPGDRQRLEYSVAWADAPVAVSERTVTAWADAAKAAARPYRVAPKLAVNQPESGTTTARRSVVVRGVTTPGAAVTVNGRRVDVRGSGSYSVTVALQRGRNRITVVATSLGGASTRVAVQVTSRPARQPAGPSPTPTSEPTRTAQPPSPDLPPRWVKQSYSQSLTGDWSWWDIWDQSVARDPEGKQWVYSRGYAQKGTVTVVSCNDSPATRCLRYTPNNASVVSDTITYWVKDPAGNETTTAGTIRVDINRFA